MAALRMMAIANMEANAIVVSVFFGESNDTPLPVDSLSLTFKAGGFNILAGQEAFVADSPFADKDGIFWFRLSNPVYLEGVEVTATVVANGVTYRQTQTASIRKNRKRFAKPLPKTPAYISDDDD